MPNPSSTLSAAFARDIWTSLGGDPVLLQNLSGTGEGGLPSVFAVSDLAAGSIGAAGIAIAELASAQGGDAPPVEVDRRLASFWFGSTLRPEGWSMPPPWDPIAGDYQAADGWIRLHTNAPHHRAAALSVLHAPADKTAVADAVAKWKIDDLEQAVLLAGGCAAAMRDLAAWADHPHGKAVAAEPIAWIDAGDRSPQTDWTPSRQRPLAGIRVLDLTRVLAGPVATRWLAGFGADVLRIDPPDWNEPGVIPEVTLGKRCAPPGPAVPRRHAAPGGTAGLRRRPRTRLPPRRARPTGPGRRDEAAHPSRPRGRLPGRLWLERTLE